MNNRVVFVVCSLLAFFVSAQAQNDHADSLFIAGNWQAAIHAYENRLQSEPNNRPGFQWNRIGQSYFNLKNWKNAIQAYGKAVSYNNNPTVMYNLACAYARDAQKDSAIAWLGRAANSGFSQFRNMPNDEDLQFVKDDTRFGPIVEQVKKNALPCAFQPESQQFDFWIGRWNVFNPQGQQAGTSVIEQILGECVILENWTDFFGSSGKSFNFYNSADRMWQQTWVDDKGNVTEFIEGAYTDGAMRFQSSRPVISPATGKQAIRRLTFFNIGPAEVRQLGERSDDAGQTWQTEYDFKYIRQE
jgi:Tetratricopeptide repeat